MAKRREAGKAAAESGVKKEKRVKAEPSRAGCKAKKLPDNGIVEEEEPIQRKVRSTSHSTSKTTTSTTSKYFHSPSKKEEVEEGYVKTVPTEMQLKEEQNEEEDESEEDDWEEVEELSAPLGPAEPVLPSQSVEIEIETPDLLRRRQKKEKRKMEFEAYLRRMVNRFNKDLLVDTHKVHLMCLIASGMFRNRLCSNLDLLAITLSLLPTHFTVVAKDRIDHNYLSGLLAWFGRTFTLNPSLPREEHSDPRALLERRLASLSAKDHQEMTYLFLLVLRSLQLFCRLVLSLQPVSLKLPPAKGKSSQSTGPLRKSPAGQNASKEPSSGTKVSPGAKRAAAPDGRSRGDRAGKRAKKRGTAEEEKEEEEEEEEERPVKSVGQRPKNAKRRSVASKVSYKEESNSEGEGLGEGEEFSEGEVFQGVSEDESDDSEFEAERRKWRSPKGGNKVKTKSGDAAPPKKKSGGGIKKKEEEEEEEEWEQGEEERREEEEGKRRKRKGGAGTDEWLEVYVEKSASWVCVDVEHGVGRPQLCSQNATVPVTYVVSVDGEGHLKDLGRKYDPTWMTSSRRRRVDEEWWEETLQPFLKQEDERDAREEKELQARLLDKPLPTTVSQYKNHPLYALKRHLLKYEALYPLTAAVLGYCRGEPVYSRDCIHTLHSRDTWLKEARTVRLTEQPYKMVKGFSNRSRKARMMTEQKEEKDLPLFGEWQTEEYQPPLAVDGKVPRNHYGNVYLFKPCMLPLGCLHVRLPNLNRVARKLNLDAAPAVTGFDFHGGYSHAVTDGYVVCEEHEEILRAAWLEDQELQKQKEKEKREKRVVSNWTLLVKGLLIRERLRKRYGMRAPGPGGAGVSGQTPTQDGEGAGGLSSDEEGAVSEGPPAPSAARALAMSWPRNMQQQQQQQQEKEEEEGGKGGALRKRSSRREKRGQDKLLFPFEKV